MGLPSKRRVRHTFGDQTHWVESSNLWKSYSCMNSMHCLNHANGINSVKYWACKRNQWVMRTPILSYLLISTICLRKYSFKFYAEEKFKQKVINYLACLTDSERCNELINSKNLRKSIDSVRISPVAWLKPGRLAMSSAAFLCSAIKRLLITPVQPKR